MRAAAASLWLMVGLTQPCKAITIVNTEVLHNRDKYYVAFEVLVNADSRNVRRLMTDYAHLNRISGTIIESRILATENDKQRVGLTIRSCVLFFCKTIKKVEDVETLENGDIVTIALPQFSDFHYAMEHWRILDEQTRTRIKYQAELWPSFYIPPLIGPWLVKSKIRAELKTSATILETLAHP